MHARRKKNKEKKLRLKAEEDERIAEKQKENDENDMMAIEEMKQRLQEAEDARIEAFEAKMRLPKLKRYYVAGSKRPYLSIVDYACGFKDTLEAALKHQ